MVTKRKRRAPARRRTRVSLKTRANPRRKRRNTWYGDRPGHRKAAKTGWRRKRSGKPSLTSSPTYRKRWRKRRVRKNPGTRTPQRMVKRMFSRDYLTSALTIGGGVALGMSAMPLVYRLVPATMRAQASNFLGVVHVAVGSLLIGFAKNKRGQQLGLVFAGTGVYDLIARNIPQLQLVGLPREGGVLAQMLPAPATAAENAAASYRVARRPGTAALAASYETVGASYSADNPYAELGCFDG